MRRLAGLVVTALAAIAAAAVLGEYDLTVFTRVLAAVLLGLLLAEVAMLVAGEVDIVLTTASALAAAAAMLAAAWLFADRRWSWVPGQAWLGPPVAALAAAAWLRSSRRRAGHNPSS